MPQEDLNYSSLVIPRLDRLDVGTMAQVIYDPGVTGFRFLQESDSMTISGNPNVTISSGARVGVTGLVGITGNAYTSNIQVVTSGNQSIPVGAKSWSVTVESGAASVAGRQLSTPTAIYGGGYDGRFTLGTAILVGCTGGRAIVTWET